MAKKSAKKEEAATAAPAAPSLQEQVDALRSELQQVRGALASAQGALDECVNLLKRKFPYG